MGIGHRVYKVRDPRAAPLMENVREDGRGDRRARRGSTSRASWKQLAMEDEYFRSRNLSANVDFYSAPLLYSIGIPVDAFTCMFAMSRIVGWTAHVYEQQANNRLIRPLSNWTGEHQLPWVPDRSSADSSRVDRCRSVRKKKPRFAGATRPGCLFGTLFIAALNPVLLLGKVQQLLAELRRGDVDQRVHALADRLGVAGRPRHTRSRRSARGCAW